MEMTKVTSLTFHPGTRNNDSLLVRLDKKTSDSGSRSFFPLRIRLVVTGRRFSEEQTKSINVVVTFY